MSISEALQSQTKKVSEDVEYKQTPQNAEDGIDSHDYHNKFPSPVLIAMSALNENLEHHKQFYQNDYIQEEGLDLDTQCGKLNSQYISASNKKDADPSTSLQISLDSQHEDIENQKHDNYNKNLIQKTSNLEDIYCNSSIENIGYFRLLDAKNTLQSMIKYNFPDLAFEIVNVCNPLDKDFFKNYILNTLITINDKVPPRVIERSKPMLCCKNLLSTIRTRGYASIVIALISICLMIINFLSYKNQIGFSFSFVLACVISIISVISYYLFFKQLTLFSYQFFFSWALFFIGVSCSYLILFLTGFILSNSFTVQITNLALCLTQLSIAYFSRYLGNKSIRFLVLIKAIPDSELQSRFHFMH